VRFRLTLAMSLLLISTTSAAQTNAPRTYTADGKTISYLLTVFNPPIAIQPDPARLNQNSAVNCTIMFMSRLSKGDIAGAVELTTDPGSTAKLYSAAKARMGDAKFSNQMAGLFNGDRYRFELVKGHEHVLVSEKNPDGGQAVLEKDGRFWMDRPKFQHESQEFLDLFKVVNDHAAGKLELK